MFVCSMRNEKYGWIFTDGKVTGADEFFSFSQQTLCTKSVFVMHLRNTTGYIAFINSENANLKSDMN